MDISEAPARKSQQEIYISFCSKETLSETERLTLISQHYRAPTLRCNGSRVGGMGAVSLT